MLPGHYFSPIPSPEDRRRVPSTMGDGQREVTGVDLCDDAQWANLTTIGTHYDEVSRWLQGGTTRFELDNGRFLGSDAVFLALMLVHHRPRRVVEIGCGRSSTLVLDVNDAFLGGATDITLIEPYPEKLRELVSDADLAGRLIEAAAQDVDASVFGALAAGDVLLVDSSHVLKAGSDVHHIVFEVLPRLAPGVLVHVHDVFHPFEYPSEWHARGVSFTEAYAVRALLQGNGRVRVHLWNHYLQRFHREWFGEHMPLCLVDARIAGGIWLEIV